MSIQAIAWVLENSAAEGVDRLVLLAIANHADASWCCFPAVDQIAAEARISKRQVFRCLNDLERIGEIERSSGGGRGRRNTYRVGFHKRCQADTVNPSLTLTVCPKTVTERYQNGDSDGTHNRKEPSWNPRAPARGGGRADETWEPTGDLEPLPLEEKTKRLERLRQYREGTA